jgi:uncharacterized protein (DUF697 family)
MASTGTVRFQQAKNFWNIVKSFSVGEIAKEAYRPVSVAIVGEKEKREQAMRWLMSSPEQGMSAPIRKEEEGVILLLPGESAHTRVQPKCFDTTDPLEGFPANPGAFDLVIDAGGGRRNTPVGLAVYSVEEVGSWERVVERILSERADLSLALARTFPGLRARVSQRIIRETAVANAQFAMLNALPGVVPVIGALLSAGAIADMLILTKNQAMMLYRLAAVYDQPLDLRQRSRDLAPLLGNAFGWRALAREIVGVVPGGIGLVARGAIAYAGTVALGKALDRFYATGLQPTRQQISRFYREAYAGAKEIAAGIARRLAPHTRSSSMSEPEDKEGGDKVANGDGATNKDRH